MLKLPNPDVMPGTATERFVSAQPEGKYLLGLVFKRVYKIQPTGACAPTDEPLPIEGDAPAWQPDVPPPLVSPPRWDSDLFAFKPATDVVIQGHAYSYSARKAMVETEVRVGAVSRAVRVYGDRRAEWSGGRAIFTPPEAFEKMPVRYDRAYGGFDSVAMARQGDALGKMLQDAQPAYADDLARCTPYHYPRNPSGCGFLVEQDKESVEAARVPNLEFPFDPVTPERLATGDCRAWVKAPLPAAYDWMHASWFPRLAYIGKVQEHDHRDGDVPETARGWAPRNILKLSGGRMLFFDPRFQQAASPGLSIPNLPPDAELTFKNLFPSHPERRIRLPGALPKVVIGVKPSDQRVARTQLNAVVVQPDQDRVILVLAAICEVSRRYGSNEMASMKWSIS